jgi:hypothetical protein
MCSACVEYIGEECSIYSVCGPPSPPWRLCPVYLANNPPLSAGVSLSVVFSLFLIICLCSHYLLAIRYAVFKTDTEEVFDILRWLDRTLIRLVSKFGDYRKDDPSSFRLAPNFAYYPQFIFHLRRSKFLQSFNYSPDETAFYRHMLLRENTNNSLTMIQPTLIEYSFQPQPAAVLLDASSIKSQVSGFRV